MKLTSWEDIQVKLQDEVNKWFPMQCQNLFEDYYLYFRPTTETAPGDILVNNTLPDGYQLALPERLHKGCTVEQNYRKLLSCCRRLPVLSV